MSKLPSDLQLPCLLVQSCLTTVMVSITIYLELKFCFRLDFIAHWMIVAYVTTGIARICELAYGYMMPELHNMIVIDFLILSCQVLISIALCSFLFQMRDIKEKLESHNIQEYRIKQKKSKGIKIVIIFVLIVYCVLMNILYGIRDEDIEINTKTFNAFEIIFRALKFSIDIYMFLMFVRFFKYYQE